MTLPSELSPLLYGKEIVMLPMASWILLQGSHKLWKSWKTWKITNKNSMHGKFNERQLVFKISKKSRKAGAKKNHSIDTLHTLTIISMYSS